MVVIYDQYKNAKVIDDNVYNRLKNPQEPPSSKLRASDDPLIAQDSSPNFRELKNGPAGRTEIDHSAKFFNEASIVDSGFQNSLGISNVPQKTVADPNRVHRASLKSSGSNSDDSFFAIMQMQNQQQQLQKRQLQQQQQPRGSKMTQRRGSSMQNRRNDDSLDMQFRILFGQPARSQSRRPIGSIFDIDF